MNDIQNTGNYADVAAIGIKGLDDILCGGLTPNRLYLVEGVPGSGKTTLAMQYLLEGVKRGESVLYVTLSETEEELAAILLLIFSSSALQHGLADSTSSVGWARFAMG